MTYTGHVIPGGPTDIRRLERATIRKMSVSEMHNNVYLVTCAATGEQLLIDAADDPHRCMLLVREGTGRLDHLVTTHQHWDHVRALEEVAPRAPGPTPGPTTPSAAVGPTCGWRRATSPRVGELALDADPLRGHTRGRWRVLGRPGRGAQFTGDSLFPGGVGNTKNPGQSSSRSTRTSSSGSSRPTTTTTCSTRATAPTPRSGSAAPAPRGVARPLYADVVERVFATDDDDTWFYPGRGVA